MRRVGHTTAIANAAKACGGIVLCPTERTAEFVRREHGVDARSCSDPDRLRGIDRPMLADNHLIEVMARDFGALAEKHHDATKDLEATRAALAGVYEVLQKADAALAAADRLAAAAESLKRFIDENEGDMPQYREVNDLLFELDAYTAVRGPR